MLRINNRGYKKIYVYGGSGIFDTVARAAARLFTSNAAKQVAQKAAAEVGKKAVEKVFAPKKSTLTSKSVDILNKHLTTKSQDILKEYNAPNKELNLNALIDGSAIRIEDYVKTFKK